MPDPCALSRTCATCRASHGLASIVWWPRSPENIVAEAVPLYARATVTPLNERPLTRSDRRKRTGRNPPQAAIRDIANCAPVEKLIAPERGSRSPRAYFRVLYLPSVCTASQAKQIGAELRHFPPQLNRAVSQTGMAGAAPSQERNRLPSPTLPVVAKSAIYIGERRKRSNSVMGTQPRWRS